MSLPEQSEGLVGRTDPFVSAGTASEDDFGGELAAAGVSRLERLASETGIQASLTCAEHVFMLRTCHV